jgi:ABC-type Fe3+/spermidine/putrescine transport system ATPase subunit
MFSTEPQTHASLAVELRQLYFDYRGVSVFERLDWGVYRGEFHTVLGASGSGKTTLLRLIAGLQQPRAGSVWLDGKEATGHDTHRRGVALVGQTAATYDHLSVANNLRLAEELSSQASEGLREELVGQFGLRGVLLQKPSELSGGQLQRLAIVRALLSQRPLLLMDEPLAHLQESMRSPIRKLLRRWQEQRGVTCIYVTHDSLEACEISDRVSVIGDCKVLQTAAPQTVYRRPASRAVAELLGRPTVQWIEVPQRASVVGLRPADWQVVSCSCSDERFDDVFEALEDRVRIVGRLVSMRQVESSQWWEVQVGQERILVVWQEAAQLSIAPLSIGSVVELNQWNPIRLEQ